MKSVAASAAANSSVHADLSTTPAPPPEDELEDEELLEEEELLDEELELLDEELDEEPPDELELLEDEPPQLSAAKFLPTPATLARLSFTHCAVAAAYV